MGLNEVVNDSTVNPKTGGVEVFAIDNGQATERRLAIARRSEAIDLSRNRGIGPDGPGEIVRVDHGPFVAAESELLPVSVGSLAVALAGDYLGTELRIDRSTPPVDENVVDLDDRYYLDVRDGELVAVVTERSATQPSVTPEEVRASIQRIVDAYDCTIVAVESTLYDGSRPEDFLNDFSGSGLEPSHVERLHAQEREVLAGLAHDVHIVITCAADRPVGTLMDGAAALADYTKATRNGPLDAMGVMNLLRGGHPHALVGEVESDFLEAKTTIHPIGVGGTAAEKGKIELAQDVARFANGDTDAVLVIGFRESSGGGRNEIGSVTPVADSLLNAPQIREVLDARIVPPLEGLLIEQFPAGPGESVLAIFVPAQAPEMQPYLVHGAIVEGKVEGAFFSIVRRRGEGSITTSAQQIHAYIVAGKRFLRG